MQCEIKFLRNMERQFLYDSRLRNIYLQHLQHCLKLTCLFKGRGAGVFELAPQKCTL